MMKISIWLALLAATACSRPSPQFATSLVPPQENLRAVPNPVEPTPPKIRLVPSRENAEAITRSFFVNLSTGNLEALLKSLDNNALITFDGESSPRPAAASLVDLYAHANRQDTAARHDVSTTALFLPVHIVAVRQSLNATLLDVYVVSPDQTHGTWTIALKHGEPGLPISMITLPQNR